MISILNKIIINNLYAISLYLRQIAGTLVLFVIARYLSIYDYGVFSSYRSISCFILTLACLGYNEYILVSSKNNVKQVSQKITLFMVNAFTIVLLSSVLSLFTNIELHFIFILVLLRTFFDTTYFSLILPYFQASKKFFIISIINIIYSIFIMILTIFAYIYKFSLLKFLMFSCFIGFINFLQCSIYTKTNYMHFFLRPKYYIHLLDKSIYGYIGVLLAFLLYSQIPALFVSLYIAKEKAALYFAAYTIASIIGLLITAQNQKIIPEMIKSTKDKSIELIKNNFKFIMTVNVIIFIFFFFIGKKLLILVYGQTYYSNAYYLLLFFTISNISLALANIYGAYITASGNQHLKIRYQVVAILISIFTILIFHNLQIYAAALAYFLSAAYIGIAYMQKTKQLLNEKLN